MQASGGDGLPLSSLDCTHVLRSLKMAPFSTGTGTVTRTIFTYAAYEQGLNRVISIIKYGAMTDGPYSIEGGSAHRDRECKEYGIEFKL